MAVDAPERMAPAVEESGRRRRVSWPGVVAVGVLVAGFALPLRGLLRYQGPPMEEGFMLAFPEQVLKGAIPNRDFLHLYGPGSLWVLAGVFKVFGTSLATERFFGLLQHAGIVFGVFALARPWGRAVALVCGATSLLIVLPPIGLTALAWNGGVALGLWAVWTALRIHRPSARAPDGDRRRDLSTLDQPGERRVRRLLVVAGVLAGFALLYRPDLIVALALALGAAAWGIGRRRQRCAVFGLIAGVSPIVIHIALAGPGHVLQGMVLDPVFRLRGGRSLPVPPSWDHLDGWLQKAAGIRTTGWPFPSPDTAHQVFLWFFLVPVSALFVAAVGLWRMRKDPSSYRARVLGASGLFGVGMLTQAVQRPDTAHFAWVSCVPLALVPVAVKELLDARARSARPGVRTAVAIAPVIVALVAVIPHFTLRTYVDLSEQTFGKHVFGFPVQRGDRNFYYGAQEPADAANALIADLDKRAKPGQRLLVGPVDLRKTPYSDAFFYFLYPELKPATYYIEMDPWMANRPGSGLAQEVRSADWLILSNVWTGWNEPNTSRRFGPQEPNQIVQRERCRIGSYGGTARRPLFELYGRCPPR